MAYRYNNIVTEYMEEVNIQRNKEGRAIVYVQKCNRFTRRKYYPEKFEELKKGLTK